jgi:hypothetical protein
MPLNDLIAFSAIPSYNNLGSNYYEGKYREHIIKNHQKRAFDLGFYLPPVLGTK